MKLSIEEMRALAQKAKLSLRDEELEQYAVDLAELEVLSHALLPYDRQATDAMQAPLGLSELREDRVQAGLTQAECLQLSPACQEEYIAVPRTVKE